MLRSTWNSLLITFSGTLPLGLLLMPSAVAEIAPTRVVTPPSMNLSANKASTTTPQAPSPDGERAISTGFKTTEIVTLPTYPLMQGNATVPYPDSVLLEIPEVAQAQSPTTEDFVVETVDGASNETPATLEAPDAGVEPEVGNVIETETADTETTNPVLPPSTSVPTANPTVDEAAVNEAADEVTEDTAEAEDASAETVEAEDPEVIRRRETLMEADRLYLQGQFVEAEQLYREAKEPFDNEIRRAERLPEPITDPALLSPGGQVYWRESTTGMDLQLETRTLVPLRLLVEQDPEFIPGHVRLAQVLTEYDRADEASQILERATSLYPNQPDLVRARIAALNQEEQWLEASIAARQFAVLNPNAPETVEFTQLADENLEEFQSDLQRRLRGNAIANILTGAIGFAVTGNPFGPISAVQTTALLLQGESAVGDRIADRAERQLDLMDDEEVLSYVNDLGQRLARVTGRNEFNYEFYVVMEDDLNAFALPGGKVFVNAGAITRTNSEAELAGLLAHEIAHAALSHGFQLVTEGNLTANVTQFLPYGGTLANLIVLNYNRDMERQADLLATRMLVAEGYAADGLRNLMVTLEQQESERNRPAFSWLASHPSPNNRVEYLETLIERNGYNRYSYEGIESHRAIQERVRELLERKDWKELPEDF